MASPDTKSVFRRARYEFRRLWDSYRVRAFACLLNLGGVAAGLALSWRADDLAVQIGATVGALIVSSLAAVVLVFLLSLRIASRRIVDDRITALEQARVETAPAQGVTPVYIQILGGNVRIESIEARPPPEYPGD